MRTAAHRADIQGLRAVAVLLVVLAHAGVDVFFVLSGFLITGLLLAEASEHGSVSLVDFYIRRARRILPAAALALVATDAAALFLLNFVRAHGAVIDSLNAAAFAANFHFAVAYSTQIAEPFREAFREAMKRLKRKETHGDHERQPRHRSRAE